MSAPKEWKFYYPEDGETTADATVIIGKVLDADDAARMACEYDWRSRDGWERGETEFLIVVIRPDGEEFQFIAVHQPSVEHCVREARK